MGELPDTAWPNACRLRPQSKLEAVLMTTMRSEAFRIAVREWMGLEA